MDCCYVCICDWWIVATSVCDLWIVAITLYSTRGLPVDSLPKVMTKERVAASFHWIVLKFRGMPRLISIRIFEEFRIRFSLA